MAFTASELPDVLARLDTILSGNHSGMAEMNYPTPVLEALTAMQSVEVTETLQNNRCIAVDGWFLEVGAHLSPASLTDPATQGCDLIDGNVMSTRKMSYSTSRIGFASFKITAPKCNNAVTRQEEMAKGMAKSFSDIRKSLQKAYYTLLTSNVQVNQYTGDAATFETSASGGNRLAVDTNKWDFELLRRMKLLADNNLFPERRLFLNGQNLWLDNDLANYRRNNDDARDEAAVFGDSMIFWDTRTMDTHLGRRSTFIVNPDQLIFYNTAFFPEEGVTVTRGGKEYTTFMIEDPEWSFNVGGTMVPVRYHVEVEVDCSGRNTLAERIDTILVNVSLLGTLGIGPTGFNNPVDVGTAPQAQITGVMEIVYEDVA